MAEACAEGVRQAGYTVEHALLMDHVTGFLRDCRRCRDERGQCGIVDGFRDLFLAKYLPAKAVVFATPLYWYGMSGMLKNFLDRSFCYTAASYPQSAEVVRGLMHKRLALLYSSEESYVGAGLGLLHQIQEYALYTRSELVGVVNGIGNARGDVLRDPGTPLAKARDLGNGIFGAAPSYYYVDTERSGAVWPKPRSR